MFNNKNLAERVFRKNKMVVDEKRNKVEIPDATPIFLRTIVQSASNMLVSSDAGLASLIFLTNKKSGNKCVVLCNCRYDDIKDKNIFEEDEFTITNAIDAPVTTVMSFGFLKKLTQDGILSEAHDRYYCICIITMDTLGELHPINDEFVEVTSVGLNDGILTLVYSIKEYFQLINKAKEDNKIIKPATSTIVGADGKPL